MKQKTLIKHHNDKFSYQKHALILYIDFPKQGYVLQQQEHESNVLIHKKIQTNVYI